MTALNEAQMLIWERRQCRTLTSQSNGGNSKRWGAQTTCRSSKPQIQVALKASLHRHQIMTSINSHLVFFSPQRTSPRFARSSSVQPLDHTAVNRAHVRRDWKGPRWNKNSTSPFPRNTVCFFLLPGRRRKKNRRDVWSNFFQSCWNWTNRFLPLGATKTGKVAWISYLCRAFLLSDALKPTITYTDLLLHLLAQPISLSLSPSLVHSSLLFLSHPLRSLLHSPSFCLLGVLGG